MNTKHELIWKGYIWRAVAINDRPWAFRITFPDGHYDQVSCDMKTIRAKWYFDVMQYFAPVLRYDTQPQ
jgi:hypothetical protein